jgi:hypothetical protein
VEVVMGSMPPSHARGYAGEQSMGFFLGERGYFFVEGPSGAAGHGVTTSGFDGVAFNPSSGHLIIYDNKSFARAANVSTATAVEPGRSNTTINARVSIHSPPRVGLTVARISLSR